MFDALPFGTPLAICLSDAQLAADFRPMLLNRQDEAYQTCIPETPSFVQNDDQYARGFKDGQQAAQENAAAERVQYNALIASANAIQSEPSEELAAVIRAAVLNLVEDIVGNADMEGAWLNSKVADAMAILTECDTARTLWVHPADYSLIDEATIGLKLMTDPTAARGSIRIECSQGWIEHGRSNYLEKLRDQLGSAEEPA